MTRRKGNNSSYERMFETFLRKKEIPYIAIDELRRPVTRYGTIKNFDFIVHSKQGNYFLDIKGKEFPQSCKKGRQGLTWQNWVKRDDIEGLSFWQNLLGTEFTPLIVFAYRVIYPEDIFLFEDLFNYEDSSYGMVAATLQKYIMKARIRSKKWEAYSVKKNEFLQIAKPLRFFLPELTEIC